MTPLPTDPDFKMIVLSLRSSGMTQRMQAVHIQSHESTIDKWVNRGMRPTYELGARIVNLGRQELDEETQRACRIL